MAAEASSAIGCMDPLLACIFRFAWTQLVADPFTIKVMGLARQQPSWQEAAAAALALLVWQFFKLVLAYIAGRKAFWWLTSLLFAVGKVADIVHLSA